MRHRILIFNLTLLGDWITGLPDYARLFLDTRGISCPNLRFKVKVPGMSVMWYLY